MRRAHPDDDEEEGGEEEEASPSSPSPPPPPKRARVSKGLAKFRSDKEAHARGIIAKANLVAPKVTLLSSTEWDEYAARRRAREWPHVQEASVEHVPLLDDTWRLILSYSLDGVVAVGSPVQEHASFVLPKEGAHHAERLRIKEYYRALLDHFSFLRIVCPAWCDWLPWINAYYSVAAFLKAFYLDHDLRCSYWIVEPGPEMPTCVWLFAAIWSIDSSGRSNTSWDWRGYTFNKMYGYAPPVTEGDGMTMTTSTRRKRRAAYGIAFLVHHYCVTYSSEMPASLSPSDVARITRHAEEARQADL